MRELFRFMFRLFYSWRRRVGIVSLLLALLLTAEWMRNYKGRYEIVLRDNINTTNFLEKCVSGHGDLDFVHVSPEDPRVQLRDFQPFYLSSPSRFAVDYERFIEWKWKCCGIRRGEGRIQFVTDEASFHRASALNLIHLLKTDEEQSDPFEFIRVIKYSIWRVPYWTLVLPLTVFSALLFFARPRKSTAKKSTEPAINVRA